MAYNPDIIAFTDGSAKTEIRGDKKVFKCGSGLLILDREDNSTYEDNEPLGYATNNYAELEAIRMALAYAVKLVNKRDLDTLEVLIITDSQYCQKSLSEYVYKWARHKKRSDNWRTSTGNVVNQEIMKDIYYNYLTCKQLKVKFCHMNSHLKEQKAKDVDKVKASFEKTGMKISDKVAIKFIRFNDRVDKLADKAAKSN